MGSMRITGGEYRGRAIKTTEAEGYRPATAKVREAVFSMVEARGAGLRGARVLDLFAGSGSLGMEALSRGAREAWFVDKLHSAASLIRENLRGLGPDESRWRVIVKDVLAVLRQGPDAPFDLVFVDPPYGRDLLLPALEGLVAGGWLAPEGLVLAEAESRLDARAVEAAVPLELLAEKHYGQTRIYLWTHRTEK